MSLAVSCTTRRSIVRVQELSPKVKLQTLVYDILPSTTAVFNYAIGARKLSANEQFFVGAQTVVSLLQTTQIIPDVCFITDHVEMQLFLYPGWMCLMFTCMLGH